MVWANIAQDLLTPQQAAGEGGAEGAVPPLAQYITYNNKRKTFHFQLKVDGKIQHGPQRETQAAAIEDRDKVLALRSGGSVSGSSG